MEIKKVVWDIMESKNLNPSSLSKKAGLTRQSTYGFFNKDQEKLVYFSTIQKIFNALGYRIVAVPDEARLPNGSIELKYKR
jgi:DNA-binding phage protein